MMRKHWRWMVPLYTVVLCSLLLASLAVDKVVTVSSESVPPARSYIIIDPGHGGIDCGATSCTGVPESRINLQIALRLGDLLPLLGMEVCMTRQDDRSIHTDGDTIAAQKRSDLKQRVSIANQRSDGILVSIHQNYFADSRYAGAQVFYSDHAQSVQLAEQLQSCFIRTLNPGSKRSATKAQGIYLMEHVKCPAVLIECGFISNYQEAAALTDPVYQKKICSVIASVLSQQ